MYEPQTTHLENATEVLADMLTLMLGSALIGFLMWVGYIYLPAWAGLPKVTIMEFAGTVLFVRLVLRTVVQELKSID
jgi:hypothetical protein